MKIYLFLGTHLPEIYRCVAALPTTFAELNEVQWFVPAGLPQLPSAEKIHLSSYDASTIRWAFSDEAEDSIFILLDPRLPLLPQLDRLAEDCKVAAIEPVKIITFVDCTAVEASAPLRDYYEACIFHSDVAILGNRNEASKKFIREYEKGFSRKCFPCLFLMLKPNGLPHQPEELLVPQTRRLTQLFDLPETLIEAPDESLIIEASCDLDIDDLSFDPYRHPTEGNPPQAVPDVSRFVVFPEPQ